MKSAAVYSLAVALVALVGCNRDRSSDRERSSVLSEGERKNPNEQDKSGTTSLTGASWLGSNAAVDRIVASRCAREVTCSNVGLDKHFTDGDVCLREVRKNTQDQLKGSECPNGIDPNGLDKCLDAIRNESCTNPIETIGRLAACRTSDLCLKAEAPHR